MGCGDARAQEASISDLGDDYAWLEAEGKSYVASATREESALPGRSAVVKLIEQIYFAESLRSPSQARRILRERIHSSYLPSITDRETVKVTAKRLAHSVELFRDRATKPGPLPAEEIFSDPKLDEALAIGNRIDPIDIPGILEYLRLPKGKSDRSISALLLDPDDRLLSWSWNTSGIIKTRHAEWNLCERFGVRIPEGARLWVSLKPCRMCAARIWEQAEDPSRIEVLYLENDPGPFAQGTMLDTDSPARLRYLGVRDPRRNLGIQKQFSEGS